MERRSKALEKKADKKRKKAFAVVVKSEGKPAEEIMSPTPSPNLILLHYSNGDEAAYQCVKARLAEFGAIQTLLLATGLSYGFVSYESLASAQLAHSTLNAVDADLPFPPKPHPISLIYTPLQYTQLSFATEECQDTAPVPGLTLMPEFLSAQQESDLLTHLDQGEWTALTNRRVQHFGFDFLYGANTVNPAAPSGVLPAWLDPLLALLEAQFEVRFDQMTANEYMPGDSIPPHVDSHSPFEEVLVSISLGSALGMQFSKGGEVYNVWLPARSLLCMKDEARYVWKHGIQQKRVDMYRGMAVFRSRRVSLTFRKVRRSPCECRFPEHCDRTQKPQVSLPTDVQKKYVQETYDKIAEHFSHTRYKPWPQVHEYLQSLAPGSLVLDVGCGNGKYLPSNPQCVLVGTDRSAGLLRIAGDRGFPTFLADSLRLPVRSGAFDALISIAVVHHFSTPAMRLQAVNELLRVLRPNGTALIYVWALEQSERTFESQDVFVPWHLQQCYEDGERPTESGVVEGEKSAVVYQRYYHVFVKGELEALVREARDGEWGFTPEKSYYDHSNWCAICRKSALS